MTGEYSTHFHVLLKWSQFNWACRSNVITMPKKHECILKIVTK